MGFMSTADLPTYKRGQVEWALWRGFVANILHVSKDVPPVFQTRIKRLLELDRSGELFDAQVPPQAPFAFSESGPEGTGIDAAFGILDAWCLGIALDLIDMGFKQKEVTFLMRYLRPSLSGWLPIILDRPPAGRQRIGPEDRPAGPTFRYNNFEFADCYVFLVIRKIEITEIFSPRGQSDDKTAPHFLEPIFCQGYDALAEAAERMPLHFRKAMVLEIAQLAENIRRNLERAPEIKRGRQ